MWREKRNKMAKYSARTSEDVNRTVHEIDNLYYIKYSPKHLVTVLYMVIFMFCF